MGVRGVSATDADKLRVLVRHGGPIRNSDLYETVTHHAGTVLTENPAGVAVAVCGILVPAWEGKQCLWELRRQVPSKEVVTCLSCREQLGYAVKPTSMSGRQSTGHPKADNHRATIRDQILSARAAREGDEIAGLPEAVGWLKPKEAAAYLGVCGKTFYDLIANEGLKHVRLSKGPKGQIRTTRAWMDEWMNERVTANKF